MLLLAQGAELMADFFERCQTDPGHWDRISKQGLERIYSRWGGGVPARGAGAGG